MRVISLSVTDPLIMPLIEFGARPAIFALWALDARLGVIASTGREPVLRQIRMRWWIESVQSLGTMTSLPAEPVLLAVKNDAPTVLVHDAMGDYLAAWDAIAATLDDHDAIAARGRALFALTGGLLGQSVIGSGAGVVWSLVDRALANPDQATAALLYAQARDAGNHDVIPYAGRALRAVETLAGKIATHAGTRYPRSEQWAVFRIGLFGR